MAVESVAYERDLALYSRPYPPARGRENRVTIQHSKGQNLKGAP